LPRHFSPSEFDREKLQTDTSKDLFDLPEQLLWYNVLIQAIADSLNLENKNKYKRNDAIDAVNWLLDRGKDYQTVCYRAGVNPESLHRWLWPWLHQRFPSSLKGGRIVSPEKLERKTRL
tara:strand:+ start:240 stop:596 length:357 start_codon:yes stop_codon:yes gene_type:complete